MSIYLKIDGVDGESVAKGFEGTIEVEEVDYGAKRTTTHYQSQMKACGSISFSELSFRVREGRHSVEYWKSIFNNKSFPQLLFQLTKQTGQNTPEVWKTYTFKNVVVIAIGTRDFSNSETYSTITATADFFKVSYFAQKEDGKLTSVGEAEYDMVSSQK